MQAFRQVHLDFHTSEMIKNVGKNFNSIEFADKLAWAGVQSVTCFAKCHHGWLYYPSKAFPEQVHPTLTNKNLLIEQIQACHKKDILVPIYISVQIDHYISRKHPEWIIRRDSGELFATGPYEAGFGGVLCLNTPYVEYLKELVSEIFRYMPVDGFFFDIVSVRDCSCNYCLNEMLDLNLDVLDSKVRMQFAEQVHNRFTETISDHVRSLNSDCSTFYNSGDITPNHKNILKNYSHFELESLPGGAWGYMHFPIVVRYARNLHKKYVGMTGKFHTTWGDFHSFKNEAALEFECFQMLANGAGCSIGDQMHPDGELCSYTYELIKKIFDQIALKEQWCKNVEAISEIGVLTPIEFAEIKEGINLPESLKGAVRMLQEGHYQFDVIDSTSNFEKYKLLILPDEILLKESLLNNLKNYLKNGGNILASFKSIQDIKSGQLHLSDFGVEVQNDQFCSGDEEQGLGEFLLCNDYAEYLKTRQNFSELKNTEYVMYTKGFEVQPCNDKLVLADVVKSYFDRDFRHYCSHRQAPSSREKGGAAIVKKDNFIYFSHPIFKIYSVKSSIWVKKLLFSSIDLLFSEKIIESDLPSTAIVTLNDQPAEKRLVLHVLNYIPERRGELDTIEDVIPLYNRRISILNIKGFKGVKIVPDNGLLTVKKDNDRVEFTIPCINGHQMVELNYT